MPRRLMFAGLALVVAVIFSLARRQLVGVESPQMSVWPGHVIFGLYFAVLTLALQGLHKLWLLNDPHRARQMLLLLMLACVCCDFVLVNVQELLQRVDASYGLVVLWDMATFFIWLRAIDLADEGESVFARSAAVAIAPVLALGREILFLPYGDRAERAYLDLFFGNVLVALWPLAVSARGLWRRRVLMALVFCGCFYWLENAAENLAFLAWPPLPQMLYAEAERIGAPVYWLSLCYAAIAMATTLIVWAKFPRLAARFGLR